MPTYRVLFNGYAANRAVYRDREIRIDTPLNWSRGERDAQDLIFLIRQNIKEHFSRFEILMIERIS